MGEWVVFILIMIHMKLMINFFDLCIFRICVQDENGG